jgi:hypothetical protein
MAWLGTYAHRVKVTASNTNVDADLTQFPLLLKLGTSVGTGANDVSFVFDELTSDANRLKIAVTDSTGDTQLYVEIEKWDDANEAAVLWVSKSDWVLDTDADTELYLYYDSTQADNTDYVGDSGSRTEVWDSNFLMVQHLTGAAYTNLLDSTSNNNDVTSEAGSPTYNQSAEIGNGVDFDGIDDHINTSSISPVNITMESWGICGRAQGTHNEFISKAVSDSSWKSPYLQYRMYWHDGDDKLGIDITVGGTRYTLQATNTNDPSSWTHYAGTYDGETMTIYKNGAADGTNTTPSGNMNVYTSTLRIGGLLSAAVEEHWDGLLDEVRISNIARPAAYIKANFYSMTDALVSWGTEESNVVIGPFPTYFRE